MTAKQIWKFPMTEPRTEVELPGGWTGESVKHVGHQDGQVCLWIEVWPGVASDWVMFEIFGTGHPLENAINHVGTTQIGPMVWHVYRVAHV